MIPIRDITICLHA